MFTKSEYQSYSVASNRRKLCQTINHDFDGLLAMSVYAVQFGAFSLSDFNGEELTFQFYIYQHDSKQYLALKVDDLHFGIVSDAFRHPNIPCQSWKGKVYSAYSKDGITTGVFVVNSTVAHLFV